MHEHQTLDQQAQPAYRGYPSYPSYPAAPPQYVPVTQTNAVWAFVLALVPIPLGWFVSVPLACSVIADSRDGRGRERGRGMAIASLVIVPVWALVLALSVIGYAESAVDRDTAGTVVASGAASVAALRDGDCLRDLPTPREPTLTVELVPCTERHAAEVFAVFALEEGPWPGTRDVVRLSEGGCLKRFEAKFPGAAGRVAKDLYSYQPVEDSWPGNRTVACLTAQSASDA